MTIPTPAHYIRENKTSRVPRRWVYLDTEAYIETTDAEQRQSWRLGVTCFEHCDNERKEWKDAEWNRWADPVSLWRYVAACTTQRTRTVVLAHNLGYDLRLSRALSVLPQDGWQVDLLSLGGRHVTLTLRRDKATLILCDFASWIPRPLDDVGAMVGLEKLPLPSQDAPQDVWYERCERDVEILRRANRDVLQWITDDDMGNWQRTGAGFASSNWRHKHLSDRVLVHQDADARAAEVAAIGTGRCEAWRHGQLDGGPFTEWDLPTAYARVGLDTLMPSRLAGWIAPDSLPQWIRPPKDWRALHHATVTTEVPTLGVKTDAGWCWPVGELTGWWWDSELANAYANRATVRSDAVILYHARPVLKSWSRWIVKLIEDAHADTTEVRRAVAKHMSRALPGRFGAKFPQWEPYAPAPDGQLELRGYHDYDTGESGRMLTLAGTTYLSLAERYIDDACPAMLGAIMAEVRVRLWRVIEAAGPEHVVYMDTDSVIVDRAGHRRLARATQGGKLWGLRVKARHADLEVLGPRQLILGDRGRIAGVDHKAQRIDKSSFRGERWDGMTTTLASGTPDVVVVRGVTWHVEGRDERREHLAHGATAPLRIAEAAVTGR